MNRKIGLIGGMSWVSTVQYYQLINERVNRQLGGLHAAELLLYSVDFGLLQQKTWLHAYDLLLDAANQLKKTGVHALALCANTAHLYADQLAADTSLPILHIVDATIAAARHQQLHTLGFLGTALSMEMDFIRGPLQRAGINTLVPALKTDRDYIQQTVRDELGKGLIRSETKTAYSQLIDQLIERGAEGIILGCTEIPLLISQNDIRVPVIDTLAVHAQYIADYITDNIQYQ